MRERFERFQLLWPKRQRAVLMRLARERGLTLTEITRQAIEIGIRAMQEDDEFTRRGRALKKIEALHATILERNNGQPLDIDPVEDLRKMREERDARLFESGG